MSKPKRIVLSCPHCERFQTLTLEDPIPSELEYDCLACKKKVHIKRLQQDPLEGCPVCGCQHLYQQKDFKKWLGILILVLGMVFAPWTYYMSLVGALILDAILFPFFPWMQICYRCESEFRGWKKNPKLDRFEHEIGAHYEYAGEKKE